MGQWGSELHCLVRTLPHCHIASCPRIDFFMNRCMMNACRFAPAESPLPLTPISFEILLALIDEDRHGYAILQVVEARLGAVLPLRTGTIYRALARLWKKD